MRKILDRVQSGAEYLLVAVYIYGTIATALATPPPPKGILVIIFGGQITLYIYLVWFSLLGFGLLYAKIKKRKRLHKHILLGMYLTPIYTAMLKTAFFGFDFSAIILNIVVCAVAAACWLRWKFKTEYIDLKEFRASTIDYR